MTEIDPTPFPTNRAEWKALDAERSEKLRELWATERQINKLLQSLTPMREEIARLDILLDVELDVKCRMCGKVPDRHAHDPESGETICPT